MSEPKKKNKGGRPEKWTEAKALELADEMIEWMKDEKNIYYEKFIVMVKDLYPQIISELSEKHKSFSEAIKKAKKYQELKLLEGSTIGSYNPTSVIFQLKNNHGYKDRQEVGLKAEIETKGEVTHKMSADEATTTYMDILKKK